MALETSTRSSADLQQILFVVRKIQEGDFSHKLPEGEAGTLGELAVAVNELVDLLNGFAGGLTDAAREIGVLGNLNARISVPGAQESWKDLEDNFNFMAGNLAGQLRNLGAVTAAYADGDYSPRADVQCRGEALALRDAINRIGERNQ